MIIQHQQHSPGAADQDYIMTIGGQETAAHLYERKRNLTGEQQRLYKRFAESYCMSLVLGYLGQHQSLRLQVLCRFYYEK